MKASEIIESYTDYVLNHNNQPASVYIFCKSIGIEEKVFYEHFASFEILDEEVFVIMFNETLELLSKDDLYKDYDNQDKLLSFYFTFFQYLTENRSLVVYLLKNKQNDLKSLLKLKKLRKLFQVYIQSLDLKVVDLPKENFQKIQQKTIDELAWTQFLMTLKFWLEDTSSSFEKTDIFIEKSLKASFDLIELTPLKNLIDFGKFIWKEKMS